MKLIRYIENISTDTLLNDLVELGQDIQREKGLAYSIVITNDTAENRISEIKEELLKRLGGVL
jgi:hypothetical protein